MADNTAPVAHQLIEISAAGYSHTHDTGYTCLSLIAVDMDTVSVTMQSVDRRARRVLTAPRHQVRFFLDCLEAMREVNQPAGELR